MSDEQTLTPPGTSPDGDFNFDDLFGVDDPLADLETTPDPASSEPEKPQAEPQPPTEPDFYLKSGTSVYKTREAAEEGIRQKDALIEDLRQRMALAFGVDPITRQPVQMPGQVPQEVSYSQNPDRYFQDLVTAAQKGDARAYADVHARYISDLLSPLEPIIQDAARQRAVQSVSKELTDFPQFLGGPEYQKVLEANTELKQAVETAERNFQFHDRLPGLYRLVYLASQGLRVPDLIKAARTAAEPKPTARPTATSSQQAPTPSSARPDLNTTEGRKALMQELESKGVLEIPF